MIHLASEKLLPYWEWGVPFPFIQVSGPHEGPSDITGIFSKCHLYTVSACRTGDGCGFQYEDWEGQKAREALAAFLERALVHVTELELFVRYFDATTREVIPASYDMISPNDIRTWRCFKPDEFLVVNAEPDRFVLD